MDEQGQAFLEATLVLAVMVLILAAVFRLTTLGNLKLAMGMSCRYGARLATLGRDGQKEARRFMQEHFPIKDQNLRIHLEKKGVITRLTMEVQLPSLLFEGGDQNYRLRASAAMARAVLCWY